MNKTTAFILMAMLFVMPFGFAESVSDEIVKDKPIDKEKPKPEIGVSPPKPVCLTCSSERPTTTTTSTTTTTIKAEKSTGHGGTHRKVKEKVVEKTAYNIDFWLEALNWYVEGTLPYNTVLAKIDMLQR